MHNLLEKMNLAKSISELNTFLMAYFLEDNITSLALTYYNKHVKTGNRLIYDWVSPALKRWHEHYLNEGYSDND